MVFEEFKEVKDRAVVGDIEVVSHDVVSFVSITFIYYSDPFVNPLFSFYLNFLEILVADVIPDFKELLREFDVAS